MGSLWAWYRGRRRWVRILVAIPAVLAALLATYVLARAAQYQVSKRTGAGEFIPDDADVTLRVSNLADHWSRLQSTELWKIVQKRMGNDRTLRKNVNDLLALGDLPTLEQLEDPRWRGRISGGYLTESYVLRLAGRDLAAALLMGSRPQDLHWCAATRVGFGDYLLLPFAPLALKRIDVAGTTCLDAGGILLHIQGSVVVASDDAALMASALKRKGPREPSRKPVEGSVSFSRSLFLQDLRRQVNGFPAGAFLTFADGPSLSKAAFALDFEGADVTLDVLLEGMKTTGPPGVPCEATRFAPAGAAGALVVNVGGDRLWEWARRVAMDPPRTPLDRSGQSLLQDPVRFLMEGPFPTQVPPHVQGPMNVILGSATGGDDRVYTACAVAFRSDNAAAAEAGLRQVVDELRNEMQAQDKVVVSSRNVQGQTLWYIDYTTDVFEVKEFFQPCWTTFDNSILISNNVGFLASILETASGHGNRLADEPQVVSAMNRLDKLWLKRVLKDGTVSSGYLQGAPLRAGLDGFWPKIARYLTDTNQGKQKIRNELRQQLRQAGRTPTESELDDEVQNAMKARIEEAEREFQLRARSIDYLRWAAYEVTVEEKGLRLRAALELKR